MPDAHSAYRHRLESARNRIRQLPVCPANRQAILSFADSCFSEGLSTRRVLKYLATLGNIAKWVGRDFAQCTRADVEKVVNRIERSEYAEWTKHDYKVTLKKFFRWLRNTEDGYPPEVKWLRSSMRLKRTKLPDEILTQEEVQTLIASARSARDRAFISSLYESGCRIGELLDLRVGQLQRHPHGFQITVNGTMKGPRRLLLIASAPHLADWLNQHPRREDSAAPVWLTDDSRARGLGYTRACDVLATAATRAGIRKAINPHNFRHSRATHLAQHLTEAQMKEYFGWVQGSDMASTYVHLSGRDIDHALLRVNHIEVPDEDRDNGGFRLQACPACQLDNPPSNKFCSRCGSVLDEQTARELQQHHLERRRADEAMDRLIQDRDFRDFVDRKLKELGLATT